MQIREASNAVKIAWVDLWRNSLADQCWEYDCSFLYQNVDGVVYVPLPVHEWGLWCPKGYVAIRE